MANINSHNTSNMTRDEMIKYILSHPYEKITHELFSNNEFIYSKENGEIYEENGYLFEDWYSDINTGRAGIRIRTEGAWESGWSLKR